MNIYDILFAINKKLKRERALRVISGGNKVDGLPPVLSNTAAATS